MKAFLSYPSERVPTARAIYKFVASCGVEVFFDKESILAGDWDRQIKMAQKDADLGLIVFTRESLTKPGVLQEEIKDLLRLAKRRPLGDVYLIVLRTEPLRLPIELQRWQFIDLFKRNWKLQLARALRLKAELMKVREPVGLRSFLGPTKTDIQTGSLRHKRKKTNIVVDYFTYPQSSRYWDFVNAEIVSASHREFYELIRSAKEFGNGEATLRFDEFFRDGELVSLRLEHYNYFGGAYPNYGVTSLNFAGAEIGKLELTELVDGSNTTLEFLKDFCIRAIADESGVENDAIAEMISRYVESDYWQVFSQFTFDNIGLVFNLSSYQSFPHVFGSHEVRIPWDQLRGKLATQFCRSKAARRLDLSKHAAPT